MLFNEQYSYNLIKETFWNNFVVQILKYLKETDTRTYKKSSIKILLLSNEKNLSIARSPIEIALNVNSKLQKSRRALERLFYR